MIKANYNKNRFLLIGLVASLFVVLIVTLVVVLSSDSFDDRARSYSEVAIELSPSTGDILADGLSVDLVINTHGEEIDGIDVVIEYTEELNYTGFSLGNISNCLPSDVRVSGTKINLYCFIAPEQSTYSGSGDIFASVNFSPVQEGTATINVTEVYFAVRDAREEIDFSGGSGQYSVSVDSQEPPTLTPPSIVEPPAESEPEPEPEVEQEQATYPEEEVVVEEEEEEEEENEEDLPDTSIFSSFGILGGLVLVLLSLFLLIYKGGGSDTNFSMRNKLCW